MLFEGKVFDGKIFNMTFIHRLYNILYDINMVSSGLALLHA